MAVHPIEERYGTAEMRAVWSEQNRFSCIIRAEVALAKAEAACGMIPPASALEIEIHAPAASLDRAKEIEAEISHDMMAIVKAISEVCGESGRWVHYGATSNDILDTATGLQLGQSLDLLESKLRKLLTVLLRRADETKTLVCIGRTHGQHGVPTTYGLRFAIWAGEVGRHLERLSEIRPRVVVGQMTGAVGTQAAMGRKGMEVQAGMMEYLGIGSVDVSNQVISRDRYAEYFMFCAGVATTLDKIGIEVRSLQRTEIGEVEEAFGAKQVGSSTMPHKRNPIKSEQVCGLARIIRSAVEPALLNNTLWDERDLTNSSTERIIFPESSILTDHCLRLMTVVIDGLVINRAAIRRNLAFLHGINMAESVMIELTKKGMNRQDSHERVRIASMQALAEGKPLADVLATDPEVIRYCSKTEIAALLNPDAYTGTAVQQVERLGKKLSGMTGREQPEERVRIDTALHPTLIFTAAHELRTHLQPIMGYLNLLTEDSASYGITDESRVILDRCVKSVDRENQIINQMLAISVLDAGKIPLSCSVVTVRDLIQTVIEKGGYAAKADLVIDAPPDTTMEADESKLSIVIDSLLQNAIDFSKPPRKIRVAYQFSDSEQMHRISVQDNGVGITNTQLDEIFEPFTLSGHGGKNRKYNRVGFSLSIAKKYVQMHGGYISVDSIVNLGSTFTIHIPKTPASVESYHGS